MDILFPNSPEKSGVVDPSFIAEAEAASDAGLDVCLYSHEAIESGAGDIFSPNAKPGALLLLRGWMMSSEQYSRLALAVSELGSALAVSPAAYSEAHYLPYAYPHLWPDTAESIWMEGDDFEQAWLLYQNFRDRDALVKDWVKSAKHRWREACFLPSMTSREQFGGIFRSFRQARGHHFNRGVVFRRFLPLKSAGIDMRGFPLVEEFRMFFFRGKLLALPQIEGVEDVLVEIPRWEAVAQKFSSPFVTIDVARLDSEEWVIVEAGDGGVSGLPLSIDPSLFYASIRERT